MSLEGFIIESGVEEASFSFESAFLFLKDNKKLQQEIYHKRQQ